MLGIGQMTKDTSFWDEHLSWSLEERDFLPAKGVEDCVDNTSTYYRVGGSGPHG